MRSQLQTFLLILRISLLNIFPFQLIQRIYQGKIKIIILSNRKFLYIFLTIQSILNSMGLLEKIKSVVKATDFFYSTDMLRYEEDVEYRTVTGGIFSIAIIITTFIGFASMIIDTINRTSITTQTNISKSSAPTRSVLTTEEGSNFMFAFQVWKFNVFQQKRYFDIKFKELLVTGQKIINSTQLPLQPCTKGHWSFLPQIDDIYDKLKMNTWLCAPLNSNYTMFGKYSSDLYQSYSLIVSNCVNSSSESYPCAPQQEIDELFSNFSSNFYLTLYYSNPYINSDNQQYKGYYLEDECYVIFGDKVGAESVVYFTDYQIETDISIWPFSSWQNQQGVLVKSFATNRPYQTQKEGQYANINLVKSVDSIKYSRQVQKISSVFSFIGGMIGAISAVLFFIKIYTNLSFQLQIALSLLSPQQDATFKKDDIIINFITFMKYYIYILFSKCGYFLQWQNIAFIAQCQTEISKQLSIQTLIRRLIYAQYCFTHLFEDFQIQTLKINNPKTPKAVKAIRQKLDPYSKVDGTDENKLTSKQIQEIIQPIKLAPDSQCPTARKQHHLSNFSKLSNRQKKSSIMVQDVISENNSQQSSNAFRYYGMRSKEANAIADSYALEHRRQQAIGQLLMDADGGSKVSRRIITSIQKKGTYKIIRDS